MLFRYTTITIISSPHTAVESFTTEWRTAGPDRVNDVQTSTKSSTQPKLVTQTPEKQSSPSRNSTTHWDENNHGHNNILRTPVLVVCYLLLLLASLL